MTTLSRAQGCLLGQLAGDALGSLVEFQSTDEIRRQYPDGVRQMADGGTWNTIAGQPTDDSEMALLLARLLAKTGTYDSQAAFAQYQYWLRSDPFDLGMTISAALRGNPNAHSQANGAMMRISPLGIFGSRFAMKQVAEWAMQDAKLTHPNKVCQQANALFAMTIAHAIKSGCKRSELYDSIRAWAAELAVESALRDAIDNAAHAAPSDYLTHMGWVLIALQNALYQLLHASDFEEAVVDTIMRGGDTDTTAAICGALLGAVCGREAVPQHWQDTLQNCRPEAGTEGVHRPRPPCFWPADVQTLAEQLLEAGK